MNEFDQIALTQSLLSLDTISGVVALGEWQNFGAGLWLLKLRFELQNSQPSVYIPLESEWQLLVDFNQDIWGKVQLHPDWEENGLSATFEHQQFNGGRYKDLPCRSGYICTVSWLSNLAKTRNAQEREPKCTIQRILWHVERAQQWLTLAATDQLSKPGDTFELPDFKTDPVAKREFILVYNENGITYKDWQELPRTGIVDLLHYKGALITTDFYDRSGKHKIFTPDWGTSINLAKNDTKTICVRASWIRLDAVPFVNRWQAPQTFQELVSVCNKQGIDILKLLSPLWKHMDAKSKRILLIGMPIPKKIGEPLYRYHWQALDVLPLKNTVSQQSFETILQNRFKSNSKMLWESSAENWTPAELQNRGRLSETLAQAQVVLFGAGALGSVLADQLVRMGIINLTVVDNDYLEAGNLVRHSLCLDQLHDKKAVALAEKLNRVNPSAKVIGLDLHIPSQDPTFLTALEQATLIIDVTASDDVLKDVSFHLIPRDTPVISCSLGLHARQLFFYSDLAGSFSWEEFDHWFQPYRYEEEKLVHQIELPVGKGCWHPLTPAPLNRIAGLSGMAVELIDKVYNNNSMLPVALCLPWPDVNSLI